MSSRDDYDKYNTLETALIEAVVAMREAFCNLEDPPSYIDFNIEVDGRTMDGELEVKFILGASSGYSQCTKGGNLANVVDEYKRRYGWNKRNDPLCLPRVNGDERREHTND